MKRTLLISAVVLAGCGTMPGDRAISGALIGGGVGVMTGGVGVLVGALLGGSAGYVMTPEQVDLGKPVWRQ
jgi:hypothetical protein